MPTDFDWKTLNEMINNFDDKVSSIRGSINKNNAPTISNVKYDNMELFELL
uniref:Uncharacterized protein n=1 Tax=viral metagenome TaxID=1070528 RepID=A0A6C0CC64_9ZZZZ